MNSTIFEARSTGRGALTHAIANDTVRVVSLDASGSVYHWREKVVGEVGAEFGVQNISNSGQHNCYRMKFTETGAEIVAYNEKQYPCIVCGE